MIDELGCHTREPLRRGREALAVLVLALAALAPAACSSGGRTTTRAASSSSSRSATSPASATASTARGATTTTGAGSVPVPASSGATSSNAAASSAPRAGGGNGGAATTEGAGPAPVAAGTYRYRQSGTSTIGSSSSPLPAEGTLGADPAGADGTQVLHRVVSSQSSTDTTLAFRPDGMFVTATVLRQGSGAQALTFTCRFDRPVPAPPWPPAVGAPIGGHGDCGQFTVDVSGKVAGTRTVSLDGKQVDTFVVDTTIVTHGQLESTGTTTDWFAPSLRLPVHSETRQQGRYGPITFSTNLIADLESGRPS